MTTTDNNESTVEEPPSTTCSWCSESFPFDSNAIMARLNVPRISRHIRNEIADEGFNLERAEEMRTASDVLLMCEDCRDESVYCYNCSCIAHNNDCQEYYGDLWCDDCFDNNIAECEECDELYNVNYGCENEHYRDYDDDCGGLIRNYSYKPYPSFFINSIRTQSTEPRRVSVTGFELETEAIECDLYEGAELATSIFGDMCYLKTDGSLSNGFEIVSHPMTRQYLDEVFPFDRVKELATLGMRSSKTTSCGLHVHINKGFFKGRESSFYRFLAMFHRNEAQWKRIAGRSNSSYASWGYDEDKNMVRYAKALNKSHDYSSINSNRYVALNLQNTHTIELRFFKGTLRPETLKARIESVHAVAEYSVATRNNINIKASSDWDKFREFALANNYVAFSEYADMKGV